MKMLTHLSTWVDSIKNKAAVVLSIGTYKAYSYFTFWCEFHKMHAENMQKEAHFQSPWYLTFYSINLGLILKHDQ